MSGLIYDGAPAVIADGSITPAKLSQPLSRGTSLSLSGQTIASFTGIPSWASQITLQIEEASLNSADSIYIRIGDSGGLATSGYVSISGGGSFTSAFVIFSANAANSFSGIFNLSLKGSNSWNAFGGFANPAGVSNPTTAGYKALSSALTQVALIAPSGSFDSGSVNIVYQ